MYYHFHCLINTEKNYHNFGIISGIAKVASDYLEKETIIELVACGQCKRKKEEFWTPLHWAAHYGHTDLFQVLSKHVENINPDGIEPFDGEVTGRKSH